MIFWEKWYISQIIAKEIFPMAKIHPKSFLCKCCQVIPLIWWPNFVTIVIHDPFQSPSQGNAIKRGDLILVALVTFPRWRHLNGATQFWSPLSSSQGNTLKWGDPILVTSITFARWHIRMKWLNFGHLGCLSKAMHINGVTHVDGVTQF